MRRPGQHPAMHALLAGAAIIVGWWNYGWRGLVLGLTLVVFWLVLQFNRSVRVMRQAAARPVGQVESVAMLQAQLEHGLQMAEVLRLTGSLGIRQGQRDDWLWRDGYGHELVVSLRRGVVVRWAVARADEAADATPPAAEMPDSPQTPDRPAA